jgi:predicted transposase YbfD/YdcC
LPKKTLSLIVAKGNDFVVKVKRNQSKLYAKMTNKVNAGKMRDSCKTMERNRGREETRIVKVYSVPLDVRRDWPQARSIVHVKRITERKGQETTTESYYLSSLKTSALNMATGIRAHWGIENGLHYVKDVVTNEDGINIKNTNAAAVFSMIRNVTINVFRLNGVNSIKNAIRLYGGNLNLLLKFIE